MKRLTLDVLEADDLWNYSLLTIFQINEAQSYRREFEYFNALVQCFCLCVKCEGQLSRFYSLDAGVRQGGVLSPTLFTFHSHRIIDRAKSTIFACYWPITYL